MLHLSIIIDIGIDRLRKEDTRAGLCGDQPDHGLKIFNEKRKGFDRDERTG